jgi:hypothetical protein
MIKHVKKRKMTFACACGEKLEKRFGKKLNKIILRNIFF